MTKSIIHSCSACGEDRKARSREFSSHALSALVLWGELDQNSIGLPVCEGCYREFRDLLIERNDELERLVPASLPHYASAHENPSFAVNPSPQSQIAS